MAIKRGLQVLANLTAGEPTIGVTVSQFVKALAGLAMNRTLGTVYLTDTSGNVIIGNKDVDFRSPFWVKLAVTGGAASSGVFASLANPFGASVVIDAAVLNITTQSTAASTLDIGLGANATTSNDTLIDGVSAAAAGQFNNYDNEGTNGLAMKLWTTSTFLNVAEASGNVDGLVAVLYVRILPLGW